MRAERIEQTRSALRNETPRQRRVVPTFAGHCPREIDTAGAI